MSPENYFLVGINGRFGTVFARKLARAGATVSGMDLQAAAAEPAACGAYFQSSIVAMEEGAERALAAADHVLLCIPERAVVAALPQLCGVMRADALLIDVVSVKSRIHEVFSKLDTRIGYLSIHPMFGPMEDFSGRAVCIVPMRENARAEKFATLLAQWGAQVRVLTAQEHDSAAALVQALPHAALIAFGATLAASGVSVDSLASIATPVQRLMLALTARLASGESETYWTIQAANPYASQTREVLAAQLRWLSEAVADGSAQRFSVTLADIRAYLGAFEGDLRQLAEGCIAAAGE